MPCQNVSSTVPAASASALVGQSGKVSGATEVVGASVSTGVEPSAVVVCGGLVAPVSVMLSPPLHAATNRPAAATTRNGVRDERRISPSPPPP